VYKARKFEWPKKWYVQGNMKFSNAARHRGKFSLRKKITVNFSKNIGKFGKSGH
jgi:hypothetical protein